MRVIHRWPVNSRHKRPVMRKMCPFDDVIMLSLWWLAYQISCDCMTIQRINKFQNNMKAAFLWGLFILTTKCNYSERPSVVYQKPLWCLANYFLFVFFPACHLLIHDKLDHEKKRWVWSAYYLIKSSDYVPHCTRHRSIEISDHLNLTRTRGKNMKLHSVLFL